MKFLQGFMLMLVASYCVAQTTSIQYFDENMEPISDSENAAFYQTTETKPGKITHDVKHYSIDGTLFYAGSCVDKEGLIKHGECTFYYGNGQKKYSTNWRVGKPEGKSLHWYPSGQIKTVMEYHENNFVIIEHYDSLGNQKVINGNGSYQDQDTYDAQERRVTIRGRVKDGKKEGKFQGYLDDGTLYCTEQYKDNALVKGVSFANGKEYKYREVIDFDNDGFKRHVKKTLRYPKAAKKERVQGTMYLRILLNESHEVTEVILLDGFDSTCDAEGVRVCKEWKPKTFCVRGQPIKVPSIVRPIEFRIHEIVIGRSW